MSPKRPTPADEEYFLVRSLAGGYPGGTEVPEHSHRWHQLIYAVTGVVTVWTTLGSWITPPHWAVWVPAGIAHALRFAGTTALRTLYFRPGRSRPPLPSQCLVIEVSPFLRELIVRTCELGPLDRREPGSHALATLLRHSLPTRSVAPFDLPLPASEDLRRLARHLEAHPSGSESAVALAARFGLGLRTLERRFRAECGLTFDHWRRRARMAHALRRLGFGDPVKTVASACGYRTPSAFIASFREIFGTTPGKYFGKTPP